LKLQLKAIALQILHIYSMSLQNLLQNLHENNCLKRINQLKTIGYMFGSDIAN